MPFDVKLKIVMTAQEHPHWSFRTLQKRFKKYYDPSDLIRLRNAVLSGGTFKDKLNIIKANVYDRFTEARNNRQLITRRLLQQWAIAAAAQFNDKQKEGEDPNVFNL